MKGFVKNKKSDWAYAMKRSIRPGGEVPLDELYDQYGEKHSIEAGEPFVEWLKNVKLKNKDHWEIVYDFGKMSDLSTSVENVEAVSEISGPTVEDANISTHKSVVKSLSVTDISTLSVRKARAILPKVMDLRLLKYALLEAKQLQDKDSLCRLLEKRIKELQIAR